MKADIRLRRAYEPPGEDDGVRVLVDRIWPRNVRREEARLDSWLREVAPGAGLRKWYGHQVDRWREFRWRYLAELVHGDARPPLDGLADEVRAGPVTLVFGARDVPHSHAVVIRDALVVALAVGLPARRRGAVPGLEELSNADRRSLEDAAREEIADAGKRAAGFEPDVLMVGWLAEYLDARTSGLCHDGAEEIFVSALQDALKRA